MKNHLFAKVLSMFIILVSFLSVSSYTKGAYADGTLDASFNTGAGVGALTTNNVPALSIQSDGKIVIGGNFPDYDGITRTRIARINTDGTLDTTFDPGTGANALISSTAIQTDGKILIGGNFTSYDGTTRTRIARINSGGTLDMTFDPGAGANSTVRSMVIQTDGKIVIAGDFTSYDGTARNRIARVNSDGTLDTTFDPGTGFNASVLGLAIQSDGKILIGGLFTLYDGTARNLIARINSGGTLDMTFDPGAGANSTVRSMVIQTDGKIVIAGDFTSYDGTARNRIARVNSDGTLDTTFDPGVVGSDNIIRSIAIQTDGKILIGGHFTSYNGTARNRIARINSGGTLDTTFDPGVGANGSIFQLALQTNDDIVVVGDFGSYNTVSRAGIVRVTHVTTPLTPSNVPDLWQSYDGGTSNSDNITNNNTPGFYAGCSNIGHTITLLSGTTPIGTGTCFLVNLGQIFPSPALADGVYSISYTEGNISGTSAASPSLTVTIDTANPVVVLSGSSTISLVRGGTYTELGATWTDSRDGSGVIVSPYIGSVDVNAASTYTLSYRYVDVAGNIGNTVTRTVTVTAPNNGGGGGGGGSAVVDNCPNGDFSPSYYDSNCGTSTNTGSTNTGSAINSGSINTGSMNTSSGTVTNTTTDTNELLQAYNYAFAHGITTMDTFEKADMRGILIRAHLAKMMVQYVRETTGQEPNTDLECNFPDIANQTEELQGYIKQACQLGIMGINVTSFNPNQEVTRAQFGTVLSRVLRDEQYNGGNPYYVKHLQALKDDGIMNSITSPSMIELRGYVMLMMMRADMNK